MKFSEIFYTLQGEGQLVGVPSVFFRTSYCNLRCGWCDSAYTSWNPENKEITVADTFQELTKFDAKHIVITGGEPFLQKEELMLLCELLATAGHHITIETNATIFAPVKADLISMSPKLANSTPEGLPWSERQQQERIKVEVIRQFLEQYECQVKFVIDQPKDIAEVNHLVKEIPIPRDVVMLMPQGIDTEMLDQQQKWLVEMCKEYGYRYSPRLHIYIWGNRRGT
jgi:7-carboxy-7-deazaguanine synthase